MTEMLRQRAPSACSENCVVRIQEPFVRKIDGPGDVSKNISFLGGKTGRNLTGLDVAAHRPGVGLSALSGTVKWRQFYCATPVDIWPHLSWRAGDGRYVHRQVMRSCLIAYILRCPR